MDSIYEKITFLVRYLNECTKAYDEGNPKITDEEWDNKYFELQELEKETGLILSNSPTQTISYGVVNALSKVEHSHKMLSLEKTKSAEEVVSFVGNKNFLTMCKMDGLTCSLTYRNGELVSAETRGNGFVGEDILHNARILPSIPHKIPYMNELVIDGEIICTYGDFEQFSSEYKNPRNFAAGSIRLLDSKECSNRNLTFVAWDVITPMYFDDGIEYRLSQKLDYLIPFGFTVVPFYCHNGSLLSSKIMEVFIEDMKVAAQKSGYPIDGVVVKFDDCAYGRSLGETTHHFKNALAYKFYDETFPTYLLDIEWTMGRTGVLTPVAVFEPIDVDGSTVERASLHNISIMEELLGEPYKGQKVEVFKANMIIPQVYSAEKMSEDFLHYPEVPFIDIPEVCPVCGGQVMKRINVDSTFLVCTNPSCDGKLINRLDHFCGKKGLDMKGISKATLEKLIDWGWVEDFTSIFELSVHKDEWIKKPGFGVKSVEKVLNAINTGANCELHQFIAALGIPLIGSTASKELAKHFKTWEEFVEAAEGGFAFYTLPNFGGEMHNSIVEFNYAEARLLATHYIHFNVPEVSESAPSGSDLTGKTFVITGKLTHFKNRDEIKTRIEALGGKVTGSVSKNTNYLINNDVNSTSSKNMTAKSLGIPILSESDFIQTFGIK
jgi:DNA ligase (NAD+)